MCIWKFTHLVDYVFPQCDLQCRAELLMSQTKGGIPDTWILLDIQSTVDLFAKASLLTNIREVLDNLRIYCNARKVTTNIMDGLPGYGPVWIYRKGIVTFPRAV